jgi:O-antigen/teichoic acid export membrane protein
MKLKAIIEKLAKPIKQHLFKNAIYLMLTSGITSLLGFLFWVLVARLYPADQVGLATALISGVSLLATFSKLGFDYALIRFLPEENDQKSMIDTSFSVVGIFSLLLAVIFIAGLGWWSKELLFVQQNFFLCVIFVILTAVNSLAMIQSCVFIGLRSSQYSFVQSLISGLLKMPLPVILSSLGLIGIFFSWGIAISAALLVGVLYSTPRIISGYHYRLLIRKPVINKMFHFSTYNYISDILDALPALLFPLIVLNLLPHEMNAYYYMAYTVSSILVMIPVAVNSSLFAEGSYEPQKLPSNIIKTIKFTLLLLIPAILLIVLLGDKLLLAFGKQYSQNATHLLWLLAFSSLPMAIIRIYVTINRIRLKMRPVIIVFAVNTLGILATSYFLVPRMGLMGIGLSWISVQTVMALVTGYLIIRSENLWAYMKRE